MVESELLKLLGVEVEGLFGVFDHRIELNVEDRVTILHGPNGVGKTTLLRMIDAVLGNNLRLFHTVPFSRFKLRFSGGNELEISPVSNTPDELAIRLVGQGEPKTMNVDISHSVHAESLAEKVDHLTPAPDVVDSWIDMRDGEVLSDSEVIGQYGKGMYLDLLPTMEQWFSDFTEKVNVHLIETQRLGQPRSTGMRGFRRRRLAGRPAPTVIECSHDLRDRLADAMASYGRQSQALDQSFPQRMLSNPELEPLGAEDLTARMESLVNLTAKLQSLGILDESPVHHLDRMGLDDLDPMRAQVMTLYVEDTDNKLKALEDLSRRVRLLLDSLNVKFRHKTLVLNRNKGLIANSENGPLELGSLSSGEQHELVLHYNLLFRARPNAVVLIDEPELSLHVAWQKRFLSDLLEIGGVSGFDAVLATHSPYIVGDRTDLMVALGDATE